MNNEKVKAYLKKHKFEILVGGACVLIGYKFGRERLSTDEKKLIKSVRGCGLTDKNKTTIASEISEMINSSCTVVPCRPITDTDRIITPTIENLGKDLIDSDKKWKSLKLNGAMLFIAKDN